jgi:acetyl esterase
MTRTVAALDLGGTHVTAGRVDLDSSIVDDRARVALPADASRDELLALIVRALAAAAEGVDVVGVAAPGPFDYGGGISWIEHKLQPLCGVDLRRALAAGIGLPAAAVSFVNDAEAFLIGEWWSGAAARHRRAAGVTLGTGLGSAFLEDGRPVSSGARVPPEGAIYLLEHRGQPVEETISRAALIARYGVPDLDVEDLAERAHTGDEHARRVFFDAASALGEVLEPWLRSFEATCLVVGGSIALAWDLLEPGLQASLDGLELEMVAPATLGDDAALLGAARHAAGLVPAARATMAPEVATLRRGRIASGVRPLHELSVAEARAAQARETPAARGPDVEVADLPSPVPIRLFQPAGAEPLPVCIWLSGGGWVLDTSDASEPTCRRFAADTPCAVAAVRYRLAPEHPFPIALEDCVTAVRWIVARGSGWRLDVSRVAIGGTSAGANLAAATALRARDAGDLSFSAQVLVYPALLCGAETRSMQKEGDWVFLDRGAVEWCWSHYLDDPADGRNPLASPLRALDLRGLPRTLVVTAELDPLRDEAELYAARLRSAGVETARSRFEGVPHGFFSLVDQLDAAGKAQRLVVSMLRHSFESADP